MHSRMLPACRSPFSEGEVMEEIVSIGISGLRDRGVDFIDFVEKWRRGNVVIGNMRIGWCRGRKPLVEFLIMRVGGVFQDVDMDSEGAVCVDIRVGVGLPQKCFVWSLVQEEL